MYKSILNPVIKVLSASCHWGLLQWCSSWSDIVGQLISPEVLWQSRSTHRIIKSLDVIDYLMTIFISRGVCFRPTVLGSSCSPCSSCRGDFSCCFIPLCYVYHAPLLSCPLMVIDPPPVSSHAFPLLAQNGAFGVIENSRSCSFGYDQRVEVFGKGGSISGANRSPQDVLVNTEEGLNSGGSLSPLFL